MPAPDQPSTKSAPPTKPCVCCHEVNHAGIPDRDLDGYVCADCGKGLKVAAIALAKDRIAGCVPHPHEDAA
jgi:hypothetical protein